MNIADLTEGQSINEAEAARLEKDRATLRHFSLVQMNRLAGIRRSVRGECPGTVSRLCRKTISANKTHCASCAQTIEETATDA